MKGGRELVKKIILIELVIVIYIILTSTIISYKQEKKVRSILYDSVVSWKSRVVDKDNLVVEREKSLVLKIDEELSERLSGIILLQVESEGEAWYVNPSDKNKYYLGRPRDAYNLFKKLGIEVSNDELFNYLYFEKKFPEEFAGRIVLDKNNLDNIYYINPKNLQGFFIKGPEETSKIIKEQGMGITNKDIRKIKVGEIE